MLDNSIATTNRTFWNSKAIPYVRETSISIFWVCEYNKLIKINEGILVFADASCLLSTAGLTRWNCWWMHDWGIFSLTKDLTIFGCWLRFIAATSHIHWNRLGLPGVWDSAVTGLPASSLPMPSSVGQSVVILSSPLPCRSCRELQGSRCIACTSTSSSQGFSPRSSTCKWPGHW